MKRFFRIYIVPGAVFQSVMVGGGYGTGREIVEYFTAYGAVGGILGIGVAFAVLALVVATTFEFSRRFQLHDYRHFFKFLLGPAWVVYEVLIILLFLLVLAVLSAAAGNILQDNFQLPYGFGLAIMLAVIGALTFFGQQLIKTVLTFWSLFLYAIFIAFFVIVFSGENTAISPDLLTSGIRSGWWLSGIQYALYNVAAVPLLLYVAIAGAASAMIIAVVAISLVMCSSFCFARYCAVSIQFISQPGQPVSKSVQVFRVSRACRLSYVKFHSLYHILKLAFRALDCFDRCFLAC